ncbi:MAG: ferritin [Candidatus Cryptobacteroides sp.]|nr:ferritin [Bacteroidales bacterium]MDY6159136.1 ferritin [Candidatus Cryptobacteroides sp.]
MISKKLENAINDQIVAELWSSNLYLSMALFLKKEGWNGSANWMFKQADEEREHALTMADYLIKRGGEARVGKLDEVPFGWKSLLEVFEAVYNHECHVSKLIDELVDLASAENDKATQDFLWGFVREQVEEEATAAGIVDSLRHAGEHCQFHVDTELAQRK